MAILSIGELLGMGPSELSGLIPYSGLDYSGTVITGISGSAIGGQGGTDSATVSAIASAYAESAASSKVDSSAFDDCCSSVNLALSGISGAVSGVTSQTGNYIDWSASGDFQPAGDYAYNSSLSAYQEISGMTAYQSAGDYAYNSSLSGKLDNSASSTWYPMEGNPSGFLTEHQSLSGYATEEYVDSSVSGKQDASGMSAYATTGDLSAKLDATSINFNGDSSFVTSISGVPVSASGGISFPMDIYVQNSASAILYTGAYSPGSEYDMRNAALIISALNDDWSHAAFIAKRDAAADSGPASGIYSETGVTVAGKTSTSEMGSNYVSSIRIFGDYGFIHSSVFSPVFSGGNGYSAFALNSSGVSGATGWGLGRTGVYGSDWGVFNYGALGSGWKVNNEVVSGSGWRFGSAEYDMLTSNAGGNYSSEHGTILFSGRNIEGTDSGIATATAGNLYSASASGYIPLTAWSGDSSNAGFLVSGIAANIYGYPDILCSGSTGSALLCHATSASGSWRVYSAFAPAGTTEILVSGGAAVSASGTRLTSMNVVQLAHESAYVPITSTDGSIGIVSYDSYVDLTCTGTTGDFSVSGVSLLGLYRWATANGYTP